MILRPLTAEDAETVRQWRNADRSGLRTPFMLTREMQQAFHASLADRNAPHRYWAVSRFAEPSNDLAAMAGLTYIQWENGLAEISLIVSPIEVGKGIGREAVRLALMEAFDRMRLLTVVGECYECNPAVGFWRKVVADYGGSLATLPRRKWWDGRLWDSLVFAIAQDGWARERLTRGLPGG